MLVIKMNWSSEKSTEEFVGVGERSTLSPGLQTEAPPLTSPTDCLCVTVITATTVKVNQSAASADHPAGEAPEGSGSGSRVVMMKVYPGPKEGANQVQVIPRTSGSSAPMSGNIKNSLFRTKSSSHIIIVLL